MGLSNAVLLFLAEQESLQKTLSSNLFVARVTLELSIVAAASDKTFPLDLSVFL